MTEAARAPRWWEEPCRTENPKFEMTDLAIAKMFAICGLWLER